MSRVMVKPNYYSQGKSTNNKVGSLGRTASRPLQNLNTTGLSSAQIDQAVFVGAQGGAAFSPYDGVMIIDSVNHKHLVRVNGAWFSTTMTAV